MRRFTTWTGFLILAGYALLMFFFVPSVFGLTTGPCTPSERQIGIGEETFFSIRVKGMESEAELSVGGVLDGMECNFDDDPLPANQGNGNGETKLRCSVSANAAFDIQELEITATEGTISDTCRVKLVAVDRPAELKVNASPSSREISCDSGDEAVYNVNVRGITGPVNLAVLPPLPAGISVEFDDNPLLPPATGTTTSTKLRATTNGKTEKGSHTLTIRADDGANTADVKVTLESDDCTKGDFSLTASPATRSIDQGASTTYTVDVGFSGSWSDAVNLSVSGQPQGAKAYFDSATLNKSGRSTLTVNTDDFTPDGSYPLLITGTGGGVTKTASVNLVIGKVADFMVSASPSKQTIPRGENTAYDVTVTFGGSWDTSVVLSVQGLPRDADAEFTPASFSGTGESMLIVTTKNTTPPGSYRLTIAGKSGGVSRTAAVTLAVTEEPVEEGEFSLSVNPDEIEAEIGGAYESEVSVEFSGSCGGPVEISLDKTSPRRLPKGLSVELHGGTLDTNDKDETLMIAVDTIVPAGEYRVNVVGKGCDMEDVATLVILVEAPRLTIVKRQSHSSVVPGQVQVYTISVTNEGDFPVTRVMVKDELENNLEFVRHTASGQHSTIERSHSFSLTEELVPGDTTSFQIHAKVDDRLKAGVTISNTAKVITAESPEPEASNTVTAITSYAPVEADALYVDKSLAYGRPKIGAILVYEIRVENRDQHGRVFDIRIDDRLPNGFKYVEGTSLLNGKNIADPAGNGRIVWENLGDLSAGDSFTLKYRVVIGLNAKSGRNENCADAEGIDGGGNEVSGSDCALVMLGPGDIKELGEIKAMVFVDTNGNGVKDADDTPFENAEIILVPHGIKQSTDNNGETVYSALKPREYVVALNLLKLDKNTENLFSESLLVRLLEGENAEIMFLLKSSPERSLTGKISIVINTTLIKRHINKNK